VITQAKVNLFYLHLRISYYILYFYYDSFFIIENSLSKKILSILLYKMGENDNVGEEGYNKDKDMKEDKKTVVDTISRKVSV
jgi:hypothetical protein